MFQSVSLSQHGVYVMAFGNPLQHELLDAELQVSVGLLQRANLLQVVGQTAVEALHGFFLVGAVSQAVERQVGEAVEVSHAHGGSAGEGLGGGEGHGGFGSATPAVSQR